MAREMPRITTILGSHAYQHTSNNILTRCQLERGRSAACRIASLLLHSLPVGVAVLCRSQGRPSDSSECDLKRHSVPDCGPLGAGTL